MSTQQCALIEPWDSTTAYLLGALLNTVQRKHRHVKSFSSNVCHLGYQLELCKTEDSHKYFTQQKRCLDHKCHSRVSDLATQTLRYIWRSDIIVYSTMDAHSLKIVQICSY